MTYCNREAFHAQLSLILDDEFIEAYKHGIVIHCCDGLTRRFYPRVFTHSADYPEKYLLVFLAGPELHANFQPFQNIIGLHSLQGILPMSTMPCQKRSVKTYGKGARHEGTKDYTACRR